MIKKKYSPIYDLCLFSDEISMLNYYYNNFWNNKIFSIREKEVMNEHKNIFIKLFRTFL